MLLLDRQTVRPDVEGCSTGLDEFVLWVFHGIPDFHPPITHLIPNHGLKGKRSNVCAVFFFLYMGVSINGGSPIAGWFIFGEIREKMDDFGVPLF